MWCSAGVGGHDRLKVGTGGVMFRAGASAVCAELAGGAECTAIKVLAILGGILGVWVEGSTGFAWDWGLGVVGDDEATLAGAFLIAFSWGGGEACVACLVLLFGIVTSGSGTGEICPGDLKVFAETVQGLIFNKAAG